MNGNQQACLDTNGHICNSDDCDTVWNEDGYEPNFGVYDTCGGLFVYWFFDTGGNAYGTEGDVEQSCEMVRWSDGCSQCEFIES